MSLQQVLQERINEKRINDKILLIMQKYIHRSHYLLSFLINTKRWNSR